MRITGGHQVANLVAQPVAVLDRVHAAQHAPTHRLRADGVRRNRKPQRMRRIADRANLLHRQRRNIAKTLRPRPGRCTDLHEVDTLVMQAPYFLPRRRTAAHNPCLPPGRLRNQPRPARAGESHMGCQNAGRCRRIGGTGVAQRRRDRRAEVAYRRKSRTQQVPRLRRGARQSSLKVRRRRFARSQPPQVHVGIDQTRDHPEFT